jgi:hypothetical protein
MGVTPASAPVTRRFALRLLLAWGLLTGLAYAFGEHYGRLVIPVYREAVSVLAPEYRIHALELREQGGQRYFSLQVYTREGIRKGEVTLRPGIGLSSQTLLGHALQHPILIFGLLLAWPVAGLARRALLLLLGVPALVVVEFLDVPLVLLGSLEDLILANVAPELLEDSPRVLAMHFMNTGGRLALAVAAALLAIAAVRLLPAPEVRVRPA